MPEQLQVEGWGWAVIPATGIAVATGIWGNRKLEGRRIAVDENPNITGYLHYAFTDTADYMSRLGHTEGYYEFYLDGKTWRVSSKGILDTVDLNLTALATLYTWYDWLEISEGGGGTYWLSKMTKYFEYKAYRVVLKEAKYDTELGKYVAKFDFYVGDVDPNTLTVTWGATPTVSDILTTPIISGYDRSAGVPDLTQDANIEDYYNQCVTSGGNTTPAPGFYYVIEAGKWAFYFLHLYERKWTIGGRTLWAVKLKSGIAKYEDDKWITYPEATTDNIHVVLYIDMFKILGTATPEILDKIYTDIKEIVVEMDTSVSHPDVKVY